MFFTVLLCRRWAFGLYLKGMIGFLPFSRRVRAYVPGILAFALALAVWPCVGAALPVDPLIEGAKLCTRALPEHERKYRIPQHLLSAIASTESGRWHKGLNLALPWPWTINAAGQGYYFDTKEEAIRKVRELQRQGITSIDVGCMQVNLHHHPEAFHNLSQAFDPVSNVGYAASFLRRNYEEMGSWKDAAAAYHSRTPERGANYVGLVYNSWKRITTRVRDAQKSIGVASVTPPRDWKQEGGPVLQALPSLVKEREATTIGTSARAPSSFRAPSMRVIEVKRADQENDTIASTRMEQGVRVIRPQSMDAPERKEPDHKEMEQSAPPASAPSSAVTTPTVQAPQPAQISQPSQSSQASQVPQILHTQQPAAQVTQATQPSPTPVSDQTLSGATIAAPPAPVSGTSPAAGAAPAEGTISTVNPVQAKENSAPAVKSGPRFIFD